jgi:hypothetical protein
MDANETDNPLPKICLICSAGRSGSTLLDLIIGGHSRAASLGEFSFLGKALALDQQCSCGEPVSRCCTWQHIVQRVRADGRADLTRNPYALHQWDTMAAVIIDRAQQTRGYRLRARLRSAVCELRYRRSPEALLRTPLPPHLSRGLRNTLYLYRLLRTEWNVDLLVDSSKNVHKAVALHERVPDSVRIVFLTRDGRGVFNSRRTSGFTDREAALAWLRYNERALAVLSRNIPADRLYRLRYEDLMADPAGAIADLCTFLGLEWEEDMMRVDPTRHHIVNGNDMRLRPDQQLRSDERWKTELSTDDQELFTQLTGTMNEQLGYGACRPVSPT